MNEFLNRFAPKDFVAIIALLIGGILKFCGVDGTVGTIMTMIVAYYFGEKKIKEIVEKTGAVPAKQKTVEDRIRDIAREESVDQELAVRVARCESGLDPTAVNVNTDKSEDRGVFQWNDKWHPEVDDACAFDVECATREFCKAVKKGSLSWWNASKKCWDIA